MVSLQILSPVLQDGKDTMGGIDRKEVGQRIRVLRTNRGMRQVDLADRLGVTLNYVGRMECGIGMASIDLFVEIAELFDVTLDYLILGRL